MIAGLPERVHHRSLGRPAAEGFLFRKDYAMTKTLNLKRRLALCVALLALLGAFLAPPGVAQAADFSAGQPGVFQPQVNWNSGVTN